MLVVTSDKCYRDVDSGRPMREDDPLGGKDPYSASKAAQEIVAAATATRLGGVALATARAGNVIGGGDWAADRLVPDLMRAALAGEPVVVRKPDAVRPWQHVLNPLVGLPAPRASACWPARAPRRGTSGPRRRTSCRSRWVVERSPSAGPREVRIEPDPDAKKEAAVLRLDSTKARERLGWTPRLGPRGRAGGDRRLVRARLQARK